MDDRPKIERLSAALANAVGWVKIGFQAFSQLNRINFSNFPAAGQRVFLDLKFHDIPNTVARDITTMTEHGFDMINMHAGGGIEMMRAAREAADAVVTRTEAPKPILLGVTLLTSLDETAFQRNFGSARGLTEQVVYLAQLAQEAGLEGVVASPLEIDPIRKACGDAFVIVTPGIRPKWAATGDQRRITTPAAAIQRGADYIVVGRPIIAAPDPLAAAQRIIDEMREA